MIQLRKVSAKIPTNSASNTTTTKEVQPPKPRDNSADRQPRQGASAYMNQSEYDDYKQTANVPRQTVSNETNYSYYPPTTATNENKKTREVHYQTDEYPNNQQQQQQQYAKPSSTSYPGLLGRSNSYNSLQPAQGQSRVTSAKQRTVPASTSLYQVIILTRRKELLKFHLEIN